jgi:glycerol kinase
VTCAVSSVDPLVLAIDQGTSSTKALLVDGQGDIVARGRAALGIDYPSPGHVEQSPSAIWSSVQSAVSSCLASAPGRPVAAVGLSTQRESVLLWERSTGRPLGPMLGWQDRRTGDECRRLAPELADVVRAVTGLPLDPMFSALKARWLLDHYDPDRRRAHRGELCLGTVDAWLTRCLTGRQQIEVGNASRTQLLDVRSGRWSDLLLAAFDVPIEVLPDVVPSGGRCLGELTRSRADPADPTNRADPAAVPAGLHGLAGVPLTAVLADSHAALFAHGAFAPGAVKATYGTGSSVIGLVDPAVTLAEGLCLTIAWQIDGERSGRLTHAAEGNIASTGATLTWLGNVLGVTPGEVVSLAEHSDSGGVVLVPAFNGLGAPWWDDQATAVLCGMSLGTTRAHLARAALESVATQVGDLAAAIVGIGGDRVLLADGGVSGSDVLMQLQADLLGVPVERACHPELSALGAAHLAGLGCGLWDEGELRALPRERDVFSPRVGAELEAGQGAWRDAIGRARWRPSPTG